MSVRPATAYVPPRGKSEFATEPAPSFFKTFTVIQLSCISGRENQSASLSASAGTEAVLPTASVVKLLVPTIDGSLDGTNATDVATSRFGRLF
jgi:hypothetical protein